MTSQSSTTDIKRAGFAPLFKFTAKQFWTTILLFTIILFFVLPVPVLMTISNRTIRTAQDLINLKEDFATDWVEAIRYFSIFIMSTFGIVTSCTRFKYLKNKVSIDFYHSLPVKRKQLFLTQLGVGALSLAIPYLFNIAFTLIIFMSNGVVSDLLLVNIFTMSWEVLVYTLFTFSISTVIGMVSGLTAVQLTLTLVAIFVVPAITLMSILFISVFSENMWLEYYISPDLFEKLSPPLRLVINPEPLSFIESSLMLLLSAAMLVGAYAIYMKRKSERAGTPVVFTPLGEVIKYILVFLGTLCGGLLFYAMMEDFFWMTFGMACGMILVFMLVNTILNKTARAMFKGWRGLIIFGAVAIAAFFVLITNAFGINTNVPNPSSTSLIEVNIGSDIDHYEFRDKEVIKALHTIYTEGGDYYRSGYKYGIEYSYESFNLDIVFYPKFGIPVAKSVKIYNKSEFIEEFKTILDSEEFKAQYSTILDRASESGVGYLYLYLPHYNFDDNENVIYSNISTRWRYDSLTPLSERGKTAGLAYLAKENKACDFDFFQQQSIGFVNIYSSTDPYYDVTLPIFSSMESLTNHYVNIGYLEYPPEEYIEHLAGAITKLTVYSESKNKSMTITDKDQISAILNAAADPLGYSTSKFTFVDLDYSIEYEIEVTETTGEAYYNKYDGSEYVDSEVYSTYPSEHVAAFLLGKVPGFVIEYFS